MKIWAAIGLCGGLMLASRPVGAQFSPPNRAGVAMGQINLRVRDVEATKSIFLQLGGSATKRDPDIVRIPGVFIVLRKAEPSGGSEGSSVNHVGFLVKDGAGMMAKFKAEGLREDLGPGGRGGYVYTADGVKIEIVARPDLRVPVQFDQIHFYVDGAGLGGGPSWSELQRWYAKFFGAVPTSSKLIPNRPGLPPFAESRVPGAKLRFSPVDHKTLPTRGRALDSIGFEVRDLKAFCAKLEAAGIKFTAPYQQVPEELIGKASLTDPWGTDIELDEFPDKPR